MDHVSKSYASPGSGAGVVILRDVCLTAQAGESIAIVGPSGSGKSTLLHIAGALDRPTKGCAFIEGTNLADLDEKALASLRNLKVGFVFQAHYLLPQFTVLENVLVPALAGAGRVGGGKIARARALLDRVNLGHRTAYPAGRLSGGERQRAALVRALINEPALLLADEPTGSLDQAAAVEIAGLLRDLNEEQKTTLIVVTHSPDLARRMQRRLRLDNGILAEAP